MSTTFDLTTTLGQIRVLAVDDKPEPSGILPNGENITDEQLQAMYAREGQNTGRAAAAALEYAATRWATQPTFEKLGPLAISREGMVGTLRSLALDLRRQHGHAAEPQVRTASGRATFRYD